MKDFEFNLTKCKPDKTIKNKTENSPKASKVRQFENIYMRKLNKRSEFKKISFESTNKDISSFHIFSSK